MCIQMLPESCYCARAAEERCYKKCGGKKPKPQVRFPFFSLDLQKKKNEKEKELI